MVGRGGEAGYHATVHAQTRQVALRARAGVLLMLVSVVAACSPSASPPPAAPASSTNSSTTAGAAPSPAAPTGGGGTTQVVKYAEFVSLGSSPSFVAQALGYFAEEGLDAQPIPTQSGSDLIAPMSRGDIDVGTASPTAGLFNAAARGIPIKIVSDWTDVGPGHDYEGIVLRKSVADTIKTPADLKGKTIAQPGSGTISEIALATALKSAGLSLEDVHTVYLGFPDVVAALKNGSIDGGFLVEPLITQVVADGVGARWLGLNELIPETNVAVLTFGPSLTSRPEVATRFMVALLKGIRTYTDAFEKGQDQAHIFGIISDKARVSPDLMKNMQFPSVSQNGKVNRASLAFDQQFWLDNGEVERPADLDALIDEQYVNAAVARLGAR
jgi:NitT/TauT family transport system substrate-binding protein